MKIFNAVQSFFDSIGEYVENFSYLFLIFLGAFIVLSVIVIAITSFAYECTLTKTLDKINKFLERNPRINDDNLVAFNNLMKGSGVPKVLRRQWQQFMLYREHPVSYYMSFKHCVENPMRNSTYRQQMTVYKIISYVLVVLSLVASVFMARPSVNANYVLQDVVIIPLSLLIGYWLVSMVLDLIHNATTGDLFQNYQYFEINMDKAMVTLPEFVDYEVLFSQEEIRKGIPVLFAYLQKRAVQEQQELEKARIKSVDHEKFDFDKAGLDGSLVLDRAMRETESFSAQRKKYLQEIERVNNEMSAMETNYKEQVKDYQRQVQTSKETVENLKSQLEQAGSTIEINYIKKQIRDEINRQQLAEKDFDTKTDKYNQEIKNLKLEIKGYDEETNKAKDALETSMLSEFNTYSIKVYDNLEKIVEEKMQEQLTGYRNQIKDLEEQLEDRNEELDNVYARYQEVLSQNPVQNPVMEEPQPTKGKKKKNKRKDEIALEEQNYIENNGQEFVQDYNQEAYDENYDYNQDTNHENIDDNQGYDYNEYPQEYNNGEYYQDEQGNMQYYNQDENANYDAYPVQEGEYNYNEYQDNVDSAYYDNQEEQPYMPVEDNQNEYVPTADFDNESVQPEFEPSVDENGYTMDAPIDESQPYVPLDEEQVYVPLDEENNADKPTDDDNDNAMMGEANVEENVENKELQFEENDFDIDFTQEQSSDFDYSLDDDIFADVAPKSSENDSNTTEEESVETAEIEDEAVEKDLADDDFDIEKILDVDNIDEIKDDEDDDDGDELPAPNTIKRKAGRPRKIVDESEPKEKRKPGRPRKIVEEGETKEKRKPGRPRKEDEGEPTIKRKVGRPKKEQNEKRPVGRPAKKRGPGRPKKAKTETSNVTKRRVGRPRKNDK